MSTLFVIIILSLIFYYCSLKSPMLIWIKQRFLCIYKKKTTSKDMHALFLQNIIETSYPIGAKYFGNYDWPSGQLTNRPTSQTNRRTLAFIGKFQFCLFVTNEVIKFQIITEYKQYMLFCNYNRICEYDTKQK